ncbi:cellulose synthase-like protein E6 isoform X2 [Hevea brasiliensis]|nr:cellulose synthase-like protein E6 isoform X2 [Hevea brasiliensis]XP_021689911.2 cellulose synthase-like protein E6 isoform X2 [Hevea brasiliensis]
MSCNYPTEKLAVYLSDDGGSDLTFYALLEASHFAKYWIPFCKTNNIEPRSPETYFAHNSNEQQFTNYQEWSDVKNLYEEMKERIESTMERGSISKEIRDKHKGFSEWNQNVTKNDHQPIVQIVIDGRDETAVDNNGYRLPTLVYMAREKRPQYSHHFKAGAMNALIRVSSEISNGPIILNLDCDMYVNDSDAIRDALCFFMDEKKGHEIAYVQHPQTFNNITKNDLYANSYSVANKVELAGMGGYGSALYCGTGCFHRTESLCGNSYSEDNKLRLDTNYTKKNDKKTVNELEEAAKIVSSCSYEKDTLWGKEIGLVYGCAVEDIVTGLTIQCRGWKSVYYCPNKEAFLGVAPNTLEVALIQHKRWCEGLFQIFLTKYCPFIYGHAKIKLGAQLGYCAYLTWAPISLPTLYYVIVPPLCLLHGIPLFPQVSSKWFLPYAYVFISKTVYSMVETSACGSTIKGWWNLQRMWVFRRTTSYFFAFIDTIIKQVGLSQTTFAITPKMVTDDVLKRYKQEVIEFGSSNTMFTIIATLAVLNLFSFVGAMAKRVTDLEMDFKTLEMLMPQVILCGFVIMVNLPVYRALFFRNDKGCMPHGVMFKSLVLASLACLVPI